MPKDTELYDLLGVKPEATDIEYASVYIEEVKADYPGSRKHIGKWQSR